jgi:hypothetical protein
MSGVSKHMRAHMMQLRSIHLQSAWTSTAARVSCCPLPATVCLKPAWLKGVAPPVPTASVAGDICSSCRPPELACSSSSDYLNQLGSVLFAWASIEHLSESSDIGLAKKARLRFETGPLLRW